MTPESPSLFWVQEETCPHRPAGCFATLTPTGAFGRVREGKTDDMEDAENVVQVNGSSEAGRNPF